MKSDSAFIDLRTHTTTGRKKTKPEIVDSIYAKFRYKCSHCGRNVYITNKDNKKLCKNCGNYVYKDKKTEFKERLENARKNYK